MTKPTTTTKPAQPVDEAAEPAADAAVVRPEASDQVDMNDSEASFHKPAE